MAGEEGIEGRGVFAVLGVSRMREEVGEGQDDVAEVQNTCRTMVCKSATK